MLSSNEYTLALGSYFPDFKTFKLNTKLYWYAASYLGEIDVHNSVITIQHIPIMFGKFMNDVEGNMPNMIQHFKTNGFVNFLEFNDGDFNESENFPIKTFPIPVEIRSNHGKFLQSGLDKWDYSRTPKLKVLIDRLMRGVGDDVYRKSKDLYQESLNETLKYVNILVQKF